MPAPLGTAAESTEPLLRALRLRSGLSLREMARRLDLDPGYLSRVERGLQAAPARTVTRIAEEIGRYQAEKVA